MVRGELSYVVTFATASRGLGQLPAEIDRGHSLALFEISWPIFSMLKVPSTTEFLDARIYMSLI